MPWLARDAFIIAPCIFSPTKWVRRRCSMLELGEIFDYPTMVMKRLTNRQTQTLLSDTNILPQRVLLHILDQISMDSQSRSDLSITSTQHRAPPQFQLMDHIEDDYSSDTTIKHSNLSSSQQLQGLAKLDQETDSKQRNAKAAKNDDAPVPEYLWDNAIVPDGDHQKIKALSVIRLFALRWWKRHVTRDIFKWFKLRPVSNAFDEEFSKDTAAGRDCITRCSNSSWWEWDMGSRPLFWRWPEEYRRVIRDGLPPWIKGPLPRYLVPQRAEKDPAIHRVIISKLAKVREKGYIIPGTVRSLTSFFTVPKGDGDVRLVYDATKSGLNAQLWAPWFLLPTVDNHLRCLSPGYYIGDIDFSEQFVNFILHEKVQAYAGVDLTAYFTEELTQNKYVIWEHWGRCGMGFVSSPYAAVQGTLMAEEVFHRNPLDPKNIFRWDKVVLNLPGNEDYRPCDPWVYKARLNPDGGCPIVANDLKIFVDDVRTIGSSYAEGRKASRVVARLAGYLGLQDAPRKRRDPSQTPGPWAGAILNAEGDNVYVSISQERWNKAKNMINWIKSCCEKGSEIEFKPLESYRGYLIYIGRTYPAIVPYLKGIHLTLDSWRPWRAEDCWKMSMSEIRLALQHQGYESNCLSLSSKPPPKVSIANRLHDDVRALELLFSADTPPQRPVRPNKSSIASYMFGDASGSGFGSSFTIDHTLMYMHGKWNKKHAQESSNFRELSNLINAIKDAVDKDLLSRSELFVFTDNFATESTFYKGTSSSKTLFELMLTL